MASKGQHGQDLVDAILSRDSKLARKLLREGADTDFVVRGDTAIHLAARNGDKEIISALLRHGDSVNKRNQNGNTPLHYVARKGREDIVTYLIGKGADINIQNEDGDTPLHVSVGYQPMDVIENYVKLGMDVNKQNKTGDTALHIAVQHSRDESVEALLLSKAEADIANLQGKKAYQMAKRNDIAELVKTYSLLMAAMESGYIMAEGTKLTYKDIEQPKELKRVGITMEKLSLQPDSRAVFYCRREKYENNTVNFQTDQEEEVISDVYHFRVRDVIDELKASFRIPIYAEPTEKQQIILKFIAGVGGSQIITDYDSLDQSIFCTIEAVLVPETTSVVVVCLCPKGQDEVIGEHAQMISSEVEENFQLDIPEGAFQPNTLLSLKVYDVGDPENNAEDEDSKSLYSVLQNDETGDTKNDSGNEKENTADEGTISSKRKRKKRKRLMSDVFQIMLTGEQPTKSVKMQIPLTEEEKHIPAEELQVVRLNDANYDDVDVVKGEPVVDGRNVTFETEHFSTFVMCPFKCTDLSKVVADIKNVKQRRQQARFFAMIRELEDEVTNDVTHLLVIECIKSDISKKRRKHWKNKGFVKQKPKHTSRLMLAPSQEFTVELSGDAKFDIEGGETGQRKLVFSPHRASFQPYMVKLPIFYKDGKAVVHIYSTVNDHKPVNEITEDVRLDASEEPARHAVARLNIKLKLPPEEDPFGLELEDVLTHQTTREIRKGDLKKAWIQMMKFLLRKEKMKWKRTQLEMHNVYLEKLKRKRVESAKSPADGTIKRKVREESRIVKQKLESVGSVKDMRIERLPEYETKTSELKLESDKSANNLVTKTSLEEESTTMEQKVESGLSVKDVTQKQSRNDETRTPRQKLESALSVKDVNVKKVHKDESRTPEQKLESEKRKRTALRRLQNRLK